LSLSGGGKPEAGEQSTSAGRARPPRYDRFAWCYEEIAALYSLGQIRRAKLAQLAELAPKDRVLYAGVGSGEDALAAVRHGVDVTALDFAASMLRRFGRRLDREGLRAVLVEGDLLDHACDDVVDEARDRALAPRRGGGAHPAPGYDAVAANFVLNIFDLPTMRRHLAHLASLVRPGGKLLIADFAPPSGTVVERWLARAYYRPVNVIAWALRLAALHPLYDYGAEVEPLGFEVTSRTGFRPFGAGPVLFESITAVRR
jgi:ubiquinone/menaquinone biosynthesis C-methylase UbiE